MTGIKSLLLDARDEIGRLRTTIEILLPKATAFDLLVHTHLGTPGLSPSAMDIQWAIENTLTELEHEEEAAAQAAAARAKARKTRRPRARANGGTGEPAQIAGPTGAGPTGAGAGPQEGVRRRRRAPATEVDQRPTVEVPA